MIVLTCLNSQSNTSYADKAASRSGIYGFLSRIYQEVPDNYLIQTLRQPYFKEALKDVDVKLNDDAEERNSDKFLEELGLEYTRLFVGPGFHLSPHESVHRDDDIGRLWGNSTVAVKRYIETCGFSYFENTRYIPDHISIEMEFMHALTAAEVCAWERNNSEIQVKYINIEKTFLYDHLAQWIPSFCEKIMELTRSQFYYDMARLTRDFINWEENQIKEMIEFTGDKHRANSE